MRVVGGIWKGRSLEAPRGKDVTRPTTDRVREAMASMLLSASNLSFENKKVLDAFAGSGALGIELLSRGAHFCCFVDSSQRACSCIKRNLAMLKADERTFCVSARDVIVHPPAAFEGPFDIVLLDPPYRFSASDVSRWLLELKEHAVLADKVLILYEHLSSLPTLELCGTTLISSKRYGTTCVELFSMGGSN